MNRKNIWYWALYDFANSMAEVVFFLYFAQWLVVDRGFSDFWYNMLFAISSLLLLLTAPILGSIADKTNRQHQYLRTMTVGTFFCFVGASFLALFFSGNVMLAALLFMLGGYFYQFSFVFFNGLLHYIAPPEKQGWISGIGQAGGWVGQIVGLLISLPLAGGLIYIIGEPGRAQAFLPIALLFIVLCFPMLAWFKFKLPKLEFTGSIRNEYRMFWGKVKELVHVPNLGLFLLAYFFFNDAIITSLNNFPIFLDKVFSMSDQTKAFVLIMILMTSVIGSLLFGKASDKWGLKKSLYLVLGCWVVVFPLLGLVHNETIFIIICVLSGVLFGGIGTVSRATMVALVPKDKINFGFSIYTLSERVSTFVGPIAWGLVTTFVPRHNGTNYRVAIITMAVFILVGIIVLRKVKIEKV